ncbi:MAG: DUF3467 domain-containing protein [Gemmatimonadetes bacterium]|nr:MAG: DUF3467 domain-containing protein [Gemmatimonadota bacterium]
MAQQPPKKQQINIELTPETAEGIYANLAIISHTGTEFVMDFVCMLPGQPKGKVRTRVVMNAPNAKAFLNALHENIHRYENQFGEISLPKPGHKPPDTPFNFDNFDV